MEVQSVCVFLMTRKRVVLHLSCDAAKLEKKKYTEPTEP